MDVYAPFSLFSEDERKGSKLLSSHLLKNLIGK
jgi:hypothetical protein